jgi:hypothetical protein
MHLADEHSLNADGPIEKTPARLEFPPEGREFKTLVCQTSVNAFNEVLIRWIILAHLALSCVENLEFRALIKLLNEGLYEYLYKSGGTIRNLILKDFAVRKERVKTSLAQAKSVIHISFDLWTSGNNMAFLGVVAHYLDETFTARSLLIALRQLSGPHSGENQSFLLVEIIKEFRFEQRLGYFISDNVTSNDSAVNFTCESLKIKNAVQRRLRCLGHVINLAAKAFLFGNDEGSFDFEISKLAHLRLEVRQALETLAFWRKRGPIGRLHNIIIWIQRTPQRRQQFMNVTIDCASIRNGQSSSQRIFSS